MGNHVRKSDSNVKPDLATSHYVYLGRKLKSFYLLNLPCDTYANNVSYSPYKIGISFNILKVKQFQAVIQGKNFIRILRC